MRVMPSDSREYRGCGPGACEPRPLNGAPMDDDTLLFMTIMFSVNVLLILVVVSVETIIAPFIRWLI